MPAPDFAPFVRVAALIWGVAALRVAAWRRAGRGRLPCPVAARTTQSAITHLGSSFYGMVSFGRTLQVLRGYHVVAREPRKSDSLIQILERDSFARGVPTYT